MRIQKLIYGFEGLSEIHDFLRAEKREGYSLSLYNEMDETAAKVACSFDDIEDVIDYVFNLEHDFPDWIGINELSNSYAVGLNFTRGRIKTPGVYRWNGSALERVS